MLANHIDKIRALESTLAEHGAMEGEIDALRGMMEDRKRYVEVELGRDASRHHEDEQEIDDIDDDARSIIHPIIPHELERVVEEDEDQIRAEEDRRRRREELGRPRTPEPTGLGLTEDDTTCIIVITAVAMTTSTFTGPNNDRPLRLLNPKGKKSSVCIAELRQPTTVNVVRNPKRSWASTLLVPAGQSTRRAAARRRILSVRYGFVTFGFKGPASKTVDWILAAVSTPGFADVVARGIRRADALRGQHSGAMLESR